MSKTIGNDLKTHLADDLTTVCTCWRIARIDSQEFFYTDHDVDVVYDGDTYEADEGFIPTTISSKDNASVDNLSATCFLRASKFNETDVAAGLYDYATLDVFIINYEDTTMGVMYIAQGWVLGNVEIHDQVAQVEVRSKTQLLQQNVVELYSPGCRAIFGDARCGKNVLTYTYTGTVTAVTDNGTFNVTVLPDFGSAADTVLVYGVVTWTASGSSGGGSDLNVGYSMEVKRYDVSPDEMELFAKMPNEVTIGDTFDVIAGCDKSLSTCLNTFSNVVNFRGEPHLPGTDKIYKVYGEDE